MMLSNVVQLEWNIAFDFHVPIYFGYVETLIQ